MFRAASFGGQFALLVACHLYFLFFPYYLLIHLANKICSVLFFNVSVFPCIVKDHTVTTSPLHEVLYAIAMSFCLSVCLSQFRAMVSIDDKWEVTPGLIKERIRGP